MPTSRPTRLPLGHTVRRLSFERRTRLWLACLGMPAVLLGTAWTWTATGSSVRALAAVCALTLAWTVASILFFDRLVRPLQILANVVAALREDDFSFRARGARRGDSLGDLAFEINALASTLQQQRSSALDALTLLERVLGSMQSPVLAFDEAGCVRLSNAAARTVFPLVTDDSTGRPALSLGLSALLNVEDQGLYPAAEPGTATRSARWSVRRAVFRLHGVPHTLYVLADVAAALRAEERLAWQRLIRVLSHEINNSLTPIQSIAGSLRMRLAQPEPAVEAGDLLRGLGVIEDRSASLNRFLQAYQQLTRLPSPVMRPVSLAALVAGVAQLETRLAVTLAPGPEITLACDRDQVEQALINLVRNAADAALSLPDRVPQVCMAWLGASEAVVVTVEDNGPGLANPANLFVPFYTTKPEGSGIGLVLAQQIAAQHQGSVTLANLPECRGCIARLILPWG